MIVLIPYPSVLEFFVTFYEALPVSFRAYVFMTLALSLVIYFLVWFVTHILG